ncbi:MAG: dihydrolipoyl dehydrogenase [Pseudomonadota bacterium]
MSDKIKTQVVVLGSGPGGYSAAFRAADLGLDVVLIERYSVLGGVCLNVGCIPSKALLHMAKHIEEAQHIAAEGIEFGEPKIDLDKLRKHKEKVVGQLTGGLDQMSKMRKVKVVNGYGKFTGSNTIKVEGEDGETDVEFEHAVIAVGSQAIKLPFIPHDDDRVWDSTDALELKEVPEKMLLLGGGIIALEMGQVYSALGAKVDVVEMTDQLVPPADADVIKSFNKQIKGRFENVMLSTKATNVEAKKDGLYVTFEGKNAPEKPVKYDVVLVAVGRVPNGNKIDADKAGVKVDDRGFINVDSQMRTNVDHIFAIGDLVGQPMLAHKATHESHVAAEVIAGKKHFFEPKVIPSIMYTNPEVGWAGLTEKEAKEQGIEYDAVTFPWSASGRAIASNAQQGMTKLIFDKNNRIIGGAICGTNAGELLGEICLAIEMGCDAEDMALTIHAHPTLHESVGLAAELKEGAITDMPNPKAKKKK